MKRRAIVGPLLWTIVCLALAGPASAQYCWTVAGSTGTVDEGDMSEVSLANANLQINTSLASATVSSRYSVTGIDEDLGSSPRNKYLFVRFRDNGNGNVRLSLKQQSRAASAPTEIVLFDSDTLPSGSGFQNAEWWGGCATEGGFSFLDNVYYIEVDMSKSLVGGNPGIQTIQVCSFPC